MKYLRFPALHSGIPTQMTKSVNERKYKNNGFNLLMKKVLTFLSPLSAAVASFLSPARGLAHVLVPAVAQSPFHVPSPSASSGPG